MLYLRGCHPLGQFIPEHLITTRVHQCAIRTLQFKSHRVTSRFSLSRGAGVVLVDDLDGRLAVVALGGRGELADCARERVACDAERERGCGGGDADGTHRCCGAAVYGHVFPSRDRSRCGAEA
jgi:hypothetical protein